MGVRKQTTLEEMSRMHVEKPSPMRSSSSEPLPTSCWEASCGAPGIKEEDQGERVTGTLEEKPGVADCTCRYHKGKEKGSA